jgi:tetratricopeptide (TPR) repeat protein
MSGEVASLLVSPAGFCSRARLRASTFVSTRCVLAFVCGLCWLTLSPRARAESADDARAKAHFAAAQEYFAQQRFAEAALEFGEAYQLSGRPEMLINRARSEERAGEFEEAVTSLELLFDRHPQTSYREEAEQQLTRLRAELASRPQAPQPAQLAVPEATPVAPGPTVATSEQPTHDWKLWPPRVPTLIVGGALVASVLVSVGTGWAAHAKYKHLESRCPDNQCPDDKHSSDDQSDKDRGQRLSRVSTGFTFASIALLAATSVLWVYDVKAQKKAHVSLGVRTSLAAADAQLRWVY